jgi:hypothetical protein
MPADISIPDGLRLLLDRFRPHFSKPGFEVFTALLVGHVLAPVGRTVCGMLTAAGLAGVWHHARAHRFFASTRWDVRQVGLTLATLIVQVLVPKQAPVLVAVDETLLRRRGPRVHAASWWHDGSAAGTRKVGYGNSWVVLAILVTLPFARRPVALPVLFALCEKGGRSRADLARDLLDQIAETFPTRTIHLVADAAYGAGHFAGLPASVTITTRVRSNAVFHHRAPARTGKRGRPRLRGDRIGTPADIAAQATKQDRWADTSIDRYGSTVTAQTTEIDALWYGTWRTDPVRVILVRNQRRKPSPVGYDIAIVTTDLASTVAEIIARYASRWAIEVAFHDAKNITGVGETRNRVTKAVERTVPFTFMVQSITALWYTTNADPETQISERRRWQPWYTTKTAPSALDMLLALRAAILTARITPITPDPATSEQPQHPQVTTYPAAS